MDIDSVRQTRFRFPTLDSTHFLLLIAILGLILVAIWQGYIIMVLRVGM